MATIKYLIKGDKNPVSILIRFTNGRAIDFKRKTGLYTDPKHWNHDKGTVRNVASAEDLDNKKRMLERMRSHVLDQFHKNFNQGKVIDSKWLEACIKRFHNQETVDDSSFLIEYAERYLKDLPNKPNSGRGGQVGVAASTIKTYRKIISKLRKFEKYRKKRYLLKEVDLSFQNDFFKYLREVEVLSDGYVGRIIKYVKTFCLDARKHGYEVSNQIDAIQGFTKKPIIVVLNEDELTRIFQHPFDRDSYLDNARDWLIIGCYIGQRVGDMIKLNSSNLNKEKNRLLFTQEKTGKRTEVPIHSRVREILGKRNGEFPRQISEVKFNLFIKEVAKEVGIDDVVEGARKNPKTNRKEVGKYPKFELITSHICRRSFATNHYGKVPTPFLMGITNHSDERTFLAYIGKKEIDSAGELEKYWNSVEFLS